MAWMMCADALTLKAECSNAAQPTPPRTWPYRGSASLRCLLLDEAGMPTALARSACCPPALGG